MFLRISGSSSMTSIFFMICSEYGKLDEDGCSFADLAVQLHLPAMQFGAAFHQQEAKARAGTGPDVASAMEGLEQLLLVLIGNANPLVANLADCIASVPLAREAHEGPWLGIFHGVAEQVGKDVSKEPFVGLRLGRNSAKRQLD